MSEYRRLYISNGIYFFTVVTHHRQFILCTDQAISRLKSAFSHVAVKHPFKTHGLVILPDHLHCIWELPENDSNFSMRWCLIKRYFSIGIEGKLNGRREKHIWQKRFWEHFVRDEYDLERCMNYIYYNPVKHGYVKRPRDWVYSTFKRDVSKGRYGMNWGADDEPKIIRNLEME